MLLIVRHNIEIYWVVSGKELQKLVLSIGIVTAKSSTTQNTFNQIGTKPGFLDILYYSRIKLESLQSHNCNDDQREVKCVTNVVAGGNESFESLLRRFTRKVQQDGILSEVRHREYFEKPSIKRKRKAAAKRRKSARVARKRQ